MPHADDAGDWRDLADQLTPEQVAELERTEQSWERMAQSRSPYLRNASTSGDDRRHELLSMARLRVKENGVAAKLDRLAPIAAPPDTYAVQPWDERHQDDNGVWFRDFKVAAWPVEWVEILIEGYQYEDGRCEYAIRLKSNIPYLDLHYPGWWREGGPSLDNSPLTQAETSRLADALRKAAGRVEEHSHVGVPSAATQAVRRRWRTGEWQSVVGARILIEPWQDPAGRYALRIWVNPGTGPGWTSEQARELATALDEAAGTNAAPAAEAAPPVREPPQAAPVSSSSGPASPSNAMTSRPPSAAWYPDPAGSGSSQQQPGVPSSPPGQFSPQPPAAAPRSPSTGVIAQLRRGSVWWRALSIALALTVATQFGLLWQEVSRWNSGVAAWGFIAVAFGGFGVLFVGERRPTRVLSVWGLIILFGGAILDLVLAWVSPK